MTVLRMSDVKKLGAKEIQGKLKELKMELVKANVGANKASAKTKEIKKAISRLLIINKSLKQGGVGKTK